MVPNKLQNIKTIDGRLHECSRERWKIYCSWLNEFGLTVPSATDCKSQLTFNFSGSGFTRVSKTSYAGLAGNLLLFSTSKLQNVGSVKAFLVRAKDLSTSIHLDSTWINCCAPDEEKKTIHMDVQGSPSPRFVFENIKYIIEKFVFDSSLFQRSWTWREFILYLWAPWTIEPLTNGNRLSRWAILCIYCSSYSLALIFQRISKDELVCRSNMYSHDGNEIYSKLDQSFG